MRIVKSSGLLKIVITPKEVVLLLISKFFHQLANKIKQGSFDNIKISEYVKALANKSVDSTDYEFFTSVLELYKQFEENCEFCFNLKDNFDFKNDVIKTLDDLSKFRDDPPDVVVLYKNNYFEFELKRYRGKLDFDSLNNFLRSKIINHYSDKSNYFILLQPKPNSSINFDIFRNLHEGILNSKRDMGNIAFSINHDNKEIIIVRIFPRLEILKREYLNENDLFINILNKSN